MFKAGTLAVAAAALALTAPQKVKAQSVDLSTPGSWTQTWFGCDPGQSCYWLRIEAAPINEQQSEGWTTYRVWSFFHAGHVSTLISQWFGLDEWVWGEGDAGAIEGSGYYFEGREWYYNAQNIPPAYITLDIAYVGAGPYGDDIITPIGLTKLSQHVTVTPEPASLLLIGTGLAGLFGAHRRRRRREKAMRGPG